MEPENETVHRFNIARVTEDQGIVSFNQINNNLCSLRALSENIFNYKMIATVETWSDVILDEDSYLICTL